MSRFSRMTAANTMQASQTLADDDDWETDADFTNTNNMDTVKKELATGKIGSDARTAKAAAMGVRERQDASNRERGINSTNTAKTAERKNGVEA